MNWQRKELNQNNLQWFKDNIEPPIVILIFKFNMLPFIKTTWSCGGHILPIMLDHNNFKFLINDDNKDIKQFIKELDDLLRKKFKFSSLYPLPGTIDNCTQYRLQVDSLPYPKKYINKKEEYYKKTYGVMYVAIEKLIDKWLRYAGCEKQTKEYIKKIKEL